MELINKCKQESNSNIYNINKSINKYDSNIRTLGNYIVMYCCRYLFII